MTTPLKVLHLIPSLVPGGAEMMLLNLMEGTDRTRFTCIAVTTGSRNEPALEARAAAAAERVHHLRCDSILHPRTIRRIAAIIRQEKPDVIQTWMHKADLAGAIAGRMTGVPAVSGIHSLDVFAPPGAGRLRTWALRKMMSLGAKLLPAKIVSCSRTAIATHAARGFPRRRMVFIPNGIDTARFSPRPEAGAALRTQLGIPAEAPVIGFTGRIAAVKDLPTFLRAAARVQRGLPAAHFILCGPQTDGAAEIQALIAAMPAPQQVHVIPFRRDVEQMYPALTMLALTSRSEAFPMVLIEAMACGVPCCSTDAGDAAAIVARAGATAPPGDDAAIAATWLQLLRTPDQLALRQAVRARAAAEFSLTSCVQQYQELYSVLATPRRRPAASPLPTPA